MVASALARAFTLSQLPFIRRKLERCAGLGRRDLCLGFETRIVVSIATSQGEVFPTAPAPPKSSVIVRQSDFQVPRMCACAASEASAESDGTGDR